MSRLGSSASVEAPLKLMIALVILSLTLGIVYQGMQSFSRSQMINMGEALMNDIYLAAQQVSRGAHMTTLIVKANLDPSKVTMLDWFRLGTINGRYIEFRLNGESTSTMRESPLPFKKMFGTDKNPPIDLPTGKYLVFLRHIQGAGSTPTDYIAVWIEWTG